MNFTVQVPEGTTNHGDPRLICTPATWWDFIVFYATNYLIHAATLPAVPGATKSERLITIFNAFFVPGFGSMRAIRPLFLHPRLHRGLSPLDRAAAAGALCMVLSKESLRESNSQLPAFAQVRAGRFSPPSRNWAGRMFTQLGYNLCPSTRQVHGSCALPKGYFLCSVPFGAKFRPASSRDNTTSDSGSLESGHDPWQGREFSPGGEYNVVRVLFSLVQAIAGSITIYRARGDQIHQYGYSAFGLSVVPYVFMSVINLVASLLSEEFSTMYLVRTPDMTEAEMNHGGRFDGIVAELLISDEETESAGISGVYWQRSLGAAFVVHGMWLVLAASPLIIVGALSRFRPGEISTTADRAWIMSWIAYGSLSSLLAYRITSKLSPNIDEDMEQEGEEEQERIVRTRELISLFVVSAIYVLCWAPAIGGMIVVGNQLQEYGICLRASG